MTKQLASINKKNIKLGDKKKFQIVLVDFYDRSQKGLDKYVKGSEMTWPAIKFDQKKAVSKLTSLGETGFLPNLVLLNADGEMVSNDRNEVLKKLGDLAES